jgi:hypothetical protein
VAVSLSALGLCVAARLDRCRSTQLVPSATGVCVTPRIGSHASAVQGFSSLKSMGKPG